MGAKSNFKKIFKKKINNYVESVQKDTLNNTYTLIENQWAPVAQLDRALGYGSDSLKTQHIN